MAEPALGQFDEAPALAAVAMTYNDIFPKGSEKGETNLKAGFFDDSTAVAAIIKALQEEAAKLVEVAAAGDMQAVGAQMGKIGAQCGACHMAYRKPLQ